MLMLKAKYDKAINDLLFALAFERQYCSEFKTESSKIPGYKKYIMNPLKKGIALDPNYIK